MSALEHERVAVAFGAVFKLVRAATGLSQEDVADRAGVDRTYPSLLERGLRQPSLAAFLSIADALGIEPAMLVTMTVARLQSERGARPSS